MLRTIRNSPWYPDFPATEERTVKSLLPWCLVVALAACTPATETETETGTGPGRDAPALPPVAATPEPAPDGPAGATQTPAPMQHYQCGDLLVGVATSSDQAQLSFSGREMLLTNVVSASGTQYDDGKGNTFRRDDAATTLTIDGVARDPCTRSERASPWVEAKSRGIGFRAVGSEPGWYVEVGRGEAPPLHALLDYGERTIDVAAVQPLGNGNAGFHGIATDGTAIELRVTPTPCNDGMSGEAFEASAELLVADKSYKGCGAHL